MGERELKILSLVLQLFKNFICERELKIFSLALQLFLLKRGGEEIYVGPLGRHSSHLINYFEVRLHESIISAYSYTLFETVLLI